MSVKPRTIDNLGVDASVRYAQDQKLFEKSYVEESRLIPQKAEVSVTRAYVLSDFDRLYSLTKTSSWAIFSPPPTGFYSEGLLFSYQLIPSLGGSEKMEANTEKLQRLGDSLRPANKEAKEQKLLLALLQCINVLDKTLAILNSRRNQYQRG